MRISMGWWSKEKVTSTCVSVSITRAGRLQSKATASSRPNARFKRARKYAAIHPTQRCKWSTCLASTGKSSGSFVVSATSSTVNPAGWRMINRPLAKSGALVLFGKWLKPFRRQPPFVWWIKVYSGSLRSCPRAQRSEFIPERIFPDLSIRKSNRKEDQKIPDFSSRPGWRRG